MKTERVLSIILILLLSHIVTAQADNTDVIIKKGAEAIAAENYMVAIEQYSLLRDIYTSGESKAEFCRAFLYAGNACVCTNRYIEALEYYTIAIELSQKYGEDKTFEACTGNIGIIYALFKDYERAIYYFEKSYHSAFKNRNDYMMSVATANLVAAYCNIHQPDKAKRYLQTQIQFPLSDAQEQQFRISYNQALIAHAEGNYHGAVYYLQQAEAIVEKHNLSPTMKAMLYGELSNNYRELGDTNLAIDYCERSINVASSSQAYEPLADAYQELSSIYKGIAQPDSAAKYQTLYFDLIDSIFNRQQFNTAKNTLFNYENNVVNEHIYSLNERINFLLLIIALISIILFVIFYYNRRVRVAYKLLVTKNEQLIRQNEESKQLRAKYISSIQEVESLVEQTGDKRDERHKASIMSENQQQMLLKDITEVMDNAEIISDPDFNQATLAKMVNSNTSYVSWVINETYDKNFKSYINEYRIREACKRLKDSNYDNYTINAIAQSVGYRSTNSFILSFKKVTGMTPSVYKKLVGSNNQETDKE